MIFSSQSSPSPPQHVLQTSLCVVADAPLPPNRLQHFSPSAIRRDLPNIGKYALLFVCYVLVYTLGGVMGLFIKEESRDGKRQ